MIGNDQVRFGPGAAGKGPDQVPRQRPTGASLGLPSPRSCLHVRPKHVAAIRLVPLASQSALASGTPRSTDHLKRADVLDGMGLKPP